MRVNRELPYYMAFSVFPGIGPVRFKLLVSYFGSAEAAWTASASDVRATGIGERIAASFLEFRRTFDIEQYMKQVNALHVHCLMCTDPRYPALLQEIPDAPFLLYVLGKRTDTPIHMDKTIAVVGTRKVTPYGAAVTQKLVTELVDAGCAIVSGMAYGVDAIAHETAMAAGGKTIAVLGCGIDIIAPPSNARLYHAIADGGGAVVSEMPLGLRPNKGLFPARNRIISGLSLGVLVTEGADDSGALITARNAAEQGRDVFAVPGPITSPYSKGPSRLLKQGATLVESAEDIMEELGLQASPAGLNRTMQQTQGETLEEQKILTVLYGGQQPIDMIVRMTGLTMSAVAATLTVLEIRGIVKDYGEKVYGLT